MPEIDKAKDCMERYRALEKQRETSIPVWQDIKDYVAPQCGMFMKAGQRPEDGPADYEAILDSTASKCLRVLSAGMQTGLTSPARPWFRLTLYNTDLAQYSPIRIWLDLVERIIYSRLARTNFYNSMHKLYREEAAFGQNVMLIDDDVIDLIRFSTLTVGEYYLAESDRGIVDTLYRDVWMQARQMAEKFEEDKLPQSVKNALNRNAPYEWFPVIHCIQPRKTYDPDKMDSQNMAYESVYLFGQERNDIIMESGYREQPFIAPRWETSGSRVYGNGPGHEVLGHVKGLQQMVADLWEGSEKSVRPPLKTGGSLKQEISHLAGRVSHLDPASAESLKPIFEVKPDFQGLIASLDRVDLKIRECMYADLFLMLDEPTPGMTATEVAERHQEKLMLLGPVLENQFNEALNPLMDRVFAVLYRKGIFPPIPPLMAEALKADPEGNQIKVEYVSLLAQAQKLVSTQAIRAVTGYVVETAQTFPDVIDKFNADNAVDKFSEAIGGPPDIINPKDVVKSIREQKAKALAMQAKMQQMQQGAELGKTMSETDMESPNALTKVQESMQAV